MGLKGIFSGKEKKQVSKSSEFILGVLDVFPLVNSEDLVVTGKGKGVIHVGDVVYISNPGEENDEYVETTIIGIETAPGKGAKEAADCNVGLKLKDGRQYNIKKGTVLFAEGKAAKDIYNEYISALFDGFIGRQKLELSDRDIEQLSLNDCAEIWRLFLGRYSQDTVEETWKNDFEMRGRHDRLGNVICEKILNADEIYCIYNKATGEPHMFSRTIRQNDGTYMCTPPDILIFTKLQVKAMSESFPQSEFEIRRIENGKNRDGIYNFLGSTFYLNGACGVLVIFEKMSINADMLVPKPDYSNIKPQNIPVTNPDLVRWMLLIGQLGSPKGEDAELIYKLYYRFMSVEMVKAKFLIPMQKSGETPKPDENGKIVLKEDMAIKFPTIVGKHDRPAVGMYTDWKRFHMAFGQEWGGLVQPIEGIIDIYDCVINGTKYSQAGCYVGKETFEEMKGFKNM